jgi:predicted RNA-binding Zn ribbon-like protein
MAEKMREIKNLSILGEKPCLDFVNTVGWHASDDPQEWIFNYFQLLEWSEYAGILTEQKRKQLKSSALLFPEKAKQVYMEAIELREALYRILRDKVLNANVDKNDMNILNRWVKRSFSFVELSPTESEYRLLFNDTHELDQMLWNIVQSAVHLLTSQDYKRIKRCEGGTCGWLFIDTSRNKSRRWCSMEDCGNRAKAKRHYKKQKQQAE